MPNSVRPQRWQPSRLPHPWDSPGKNTGVGCHFHLQCMKVKRESEVSQSCPTLCDPMDCSLPGSSIHGIFQARVLEWGAIAFSDVAIQLINNVVLASDVQQSDSFIYIHIYIVFFSIYHRILNSFLCYTVRPCSLFILYIIVCIC